MSTSSGGRPVAAEDAVPIRLYLGLASQDRDQDGHPPPGILASEMMVAREAGPGSSAAENALSSSNVKKETIS